MELRVRLLADTSEPWRLLAVGAEMRRRIAAWVLTAFMIGILCLSCSQQDNEDRIRALIADGAAAAEAHDIAAILALATAQVRAMPMDLDRRGIKAVLWRTFRHYGPLAVLYPRPVVTVDESTARASVPFLIVKKEHPFTELGTLRDDPAAWLEAVGDAADLYRLQLAWVARDGGWRVNRATLERFTGTGFE